MKCFFTFAVAAALAVGMNATLWSQTGGAGGAGGAAGAGTAGATGTANTAGAAGATNGADAAGNAGAAANTNAGAAAGATNSAGAANNAAAGAIGTQQVGQGRAGTATTDRANANNRQNNAAARNMNRQAGAQNNFQNFLSPNQTPFFSDPGVRQQLNLNDNQFNTLNSAYQTAYGRYNQAVNNLNPALTPEQREMEVQRLQQQFNQGLADLSGSTITNPQARNRFNQLNRQFMGPNAFNDPSIRQQLNLNAAQVRQLRTLQNNWRQQMQQFEQAAGQDLSGNNNTQWSQMQQQYVSSLNSILTPEQQQMWTQQVGQPYPVTPNAFFTRRRPDGAVNTTQQAGAGVQNNQLRTGQGVQTPVVTPAPPATLAPTGTQPTTQGTTAPATASGTSTQGGTVR